MNKGKVILVGAGPGDPELLTLAAVRELKRAEVVVYDRLVSDDILALMPESAEKINVGKNAGDHPVPQHEIDRILLDKALEGKRVVRLKGGDSFVFGRGGEELELLSDNGVEFCVVPGITSAIAAAAYAGIPVTHRDFCSSLHIITGHKRENGALALDYGSLVKLNGTLVFLMSVASCGEIAAGLLAAGMAPDMPAAVVENGTRPEQRKLVSTVSALGEDVKKAGIRSPALILVGKVCALSGRFDWFDALPLKGRRILVTRPKAGSTRMVNALRELGAAVTAVPAVRTEAIPFALPELAPYSWVSFTSGSGVAAFFDKLEALGLDARVLAGRRVAVVGSETAKQLSARGIRADFVPAVFCGEAMAQELLEKGLVGQNDRVLFVRGRIASRAPDEIFSRAGVAHDELVVYDTLDDDTRDIDPADYELVTFTSASCVDAFARHVLPGSELSAVRAFCIGEQTAAAARARGMQVYISDRATIDSLIELIKERA